MSIAVSIFEHSLCSIGGYSLNIAIAEFGRFICNDLRECSASPDESLDLADKVKLFEITLGAVSEEISHRFLLEKVVLPRISPQFVGFSMNRTGVSSLIFAANHLPYSKLARKELTYHFFCALILGVISSLAQQRIGLLGAVLVHVSYNLHGWQYMYKQDLSGTIKTINYLSQCKIDFLGVGKDFVEDIICGLCLPLIGAYHVIELGCERIFPRNKAY